MSSAPEVLTIVLTSLGSGGVVQIINSFFGQKNETAKLSTTASEKAVNMMILALDRADKQIQVQELQIQELRRDVTQMKSQVSAVQEKNVTLEAELITLRSSQGGT